MKIAELARRGGLRASAIRYYESAGVLEAPRRVAGRRVYDAAAVDALRLVRAMRRAGFTLAEIRRMRQASANAPALRGQVREKLRQLDARIAELEVSRAALAESLACECAGRADACRLVQRTEGASGRGARRR